MMMDDWQNAHDVAIIKLRKMTKRAESAERKLDDISKLSSHTEIFAPMGNKSVWLSDIQAILGSKNE